MKYLIWLLGIISGLCVFILILFASIEIPTFDLNFYKKEYEKYNIYESINVNENDLMKVTEKLTDYIRNDSDDLDISVLVDGQTREFFNQKEKDHMVDVKVLFVKAYQVRNYIVIILSLIIIFIFTKKINIIKFLSKYCIIVLGSLLIIFGMIAFVISTDFSKYFTVFHEIFFTNDLWLLDPNTDLLINIVPLPFFMDIASFIGTLFLTINIFVILLSSIYLYRLKNEKILNLPK